MDPEARGEKLSKNELKRRMKAEKKAAEKAEKAAAKPVEETKKVSKADDALNSEEITPNEYFKLRSKAVEDLKVDAKTHPYPHKFNVTISLTEFIEKYSSEYDDLKAIITGGDSNYLSGKIKNTIFTTSNYVFKGLEYLIEANK